MTLADEQDVAAVDLARRAITTDHDRPISNGFPLDDLVQAGAERIVAQDPDRDRGALVGKRFLGPFHELREIEEEGRLQVVLARESALRSARRWNERRGENDSQDANGPARHPPQRTRARPALSAGSSPPDPAPRAREGWLYGCHVTFA